MESGLRPKACGDIVDAAAARDVRLADAVGAGATIDSLLERILTDHNIAFRDGVQGRDEVGVAAVEWRRRIGSEEGRCENREKVRVK